MAISAKDAFQLVKRSAKDFSDDECPRMAAALAYYTVFALPPLLILILMLVSAFVSRDQVQAALSGEVGRMMGDDGSRMVLTMITQAKQPGGGPMGTILGLGALVLGATGAFLQLQGALNRAWEVKPDPNAGGGLKNFITKRVLSLGMVLGIAFLLLVSLALSTALSAVGQWIGALIPGGSQVVAWIVSELVALTVVFVLFAAIFKVLPDAEIAWKDVWVGALVTALLFEVGKAALGQYLGNSNPGKAYGAAGSLALILVWIYYSSMIVLFGAEFTQTWATTRGQGIRPEEGALKMDDATPADAGDASRPRAAASDQKDGDRGRGARTDAIPRQEPVSTPAQVSERAMAAAKRDREPDHTPENERGLPGGGVGRREAVGGSGIHPVSAGDLPKGAETKTPGEIADPRRDDGAG